MTDLLRGIARTKAQPVERAPALSPEHLDTMLETLGEGRRAPAIAPLLALGFAGASGGRWGRVPALDARRLDIEDLTFIDAGLEIRADKSDPAREGRVLPVAFASLPARCVRAVSAWIDAAGLREGPLFRAVSRAGAIGAAASPTAPSIGSSSAPPAKRASRSTSPRTRGACFITAAVRQKHPPDRIRVVSGHKQGSRSFEAYVRFASVWDGYAGEGVL